MGIISHLTEFFNEEKAQRYIHELRWKGKDLECPHCESKEISPSSMLDPQQSQGSESNGHPGNG